MISLGIDIGGTGCKCVAFRDTGEQIAMSYREYPTKPGEVNLNALALRESVFFVISDCVKKLDDAKQVAAITVSSFGESFVPVDRGGQPAERHHSLFCQYRKRGILPSDRVGRRGKIHAHHLCPAGCVVFAGKNALYAPHGSAPGVEVPICRKLHLLLPVW